MQSDDVQFRRTLRASHCSQAETPTSSPRSRHDHKKEEGAESLIRWKRRPKSVSFRDAVTKFTDEDPKSSTWDGITICGSEFVEYDASSPRKLVPPSPMGKLLAHSEDQPHLDIHTSSTDSNGSTHREEKGRWWGKLKRLFRQNMSPRSQQAKNGDTYTYVCQNSRMMHSSHGGDTDFVVMF
jgi:hypothetical protein